jgi:exonuclease III
MLTKNQILKIFYVNINGLSDKKTQNIDLDKEIKMADIICFTETHLEQDSEPPIIKKYKAFHTIVNRNRTKYIGRNIKGVSVYYKEEIPDTHIEELVNERGNLVIIKLSNPHWSEIDELFIIFCYKEDRESKFKTSDYFENIKKYMITYKMENLILVGDLNGRIGTLNDNINLKLVPRKSDDLTVNGQGKEIIDFCNETTLLIANGRLERGNCTYFTLHKNEVKKSVIDYLLISRRLAYAHTIQNFEIHEPVTYTDHAPMLIDFGLPLKQNKPKRPSFHTNGFEQKMSSGNKNPYKWTEQNALHFKNDVFKINCNNLYTKLNTEKMSASEIYRELIDSKNKASIKSRNLQMNTNKIVYSDEARKSRQKYKQHIKCYKADNSHLNLRELLEAKKTYNTIIKSERKKNKMLKLHELNNAKQSNDSKRYWQLIFQNQTKKQTIKSNLRAIDFKEQIERRDLDMSAKQDSTNQNDKIITAKEGKNKADEILDNDITIEEVMKNLKSMHNSKSSGPDGIVYEMLKNNIQEVILILTKLYNNIQSDDVIPCDQSWMVPIYKNGDKNCLSSYRCINLSSCIEKLLTKIMNSRLAKWTEKYDMINLEQTGFRKGNSVIDNILLLKEMIRIYKNTKCCLYICFVDLSKAFDSIPIDRLKIKLHSILPKSKLLSFLIKLLDNKTYRVLHNGEETQAFKLKNGVPQGDSLSPTLFCLYINDLFDALRQNVKAIDPASIGDLKVASVVYADDILLMSQSQRGLIKQIKILQTYCTENGLEINYKKTKILIANNDSKDNKYGYVNISSKDSNCNIEIVDEYKYLGMWINTNTRKKNKNHIEYLAKKGRKSSFLTNKSLKEFGQINGKLLRDTYEILTLSKMKYGGEFCFKDNIKSLNQIQYQFYKRFCHLKLTTPNYCLIGEFGIQPMEFHFYKAALNYWLKLLMTNEKCLIKQMYRHIQNNIDEKYNANTWCLQVKELIYELKLEELWTNQMSINKHNFKTYKYKIQTRLVEYFRETWIKSARHSHKGVDYLELSMFNCEMKSYLNYIMNDKSILKILKLRTGNHSLSVEIDRYQNRKLYNERICKLCDTQKIQDLYHVIVECPRFKDHRSKELNFLTNYNKAELYYALSNISRKDIKAITNLMVNVEETIKNEKTSSPS